MGNFPNVIVPDDVDFKLEPSGRVMEMGWWLVLGLSIKCFRVGGRYMPVAPVSDIK